MNIYMLDFKTIPERTMSICLDPTVNCTTCHLYQYGRYCEFRTQNDTSFMVVLVIYCILFGGVTLGLMIWTLLGMYKKVRYEKISPLAVSMFSCYMLLVYYIFRFLHFVDPYRLFTLFSKLFVNICIWGGLVGLISSAAIVTAVWFDIALNIERLEDAKSKFRLAKILSLTVGLVMFGIGAFGMILAPITGLWDEINIILEGFIVIVLIYILCVAFAVIPQFKGILKTNERVSNILKLLKGLSAGCIMAALITLLYIIIPIGITKNDYWFHWLYLFIAFASRLVEIGGVILICTIVVGDPGAVYTSTVSTTARTKGSRQLSMRTK